MKELWLQYGYLVHEAWFWNCVSIVLIILLSAFYSHTDYRRLKKLWEVHQHNKIAANIIMRESGIFTKYWVRAFVRGSERWF